jgi:uncharacterized protein YkwD
MKAAVLRLFFLISISIYISCEKEVAVNDSPIGNKNPETPTIVYNVNKSLLLNLVNQQRENGCTCGSSMMPAVPGLTWNDQLATAAYDHSLDMSINNFFSHTNLEGDGPGDRIRAAGYLWKTYGENIAKGYANEQDVMTGWLSSEDHCKNIMNKNFREIGMGREGNIWTQVFGAR